MMNYCTDIYPNTTEPSITMFHPQSENQEELRIESRYYKKGRVKEANYKDIGKLYKMRPT